MDQYERLKLIYSPEEIEIIQSSTICICGLGGVGGSCLEMIARLGVKKLILVDFDRVDISNLNRQILYTYHSLGKSKCQIAKERVESYCQKTEIVLVEQKIDDNHLSFLDPSIDIVIDCIDQMSSKIALIKSCQQKKIPILSSMGMANRKDPTKIQVTYLDKTFNDPMAKSMRERAKKARLKKLKVVFSTELPLNVHHPVGSVSFVVNTAGNFLAGESIKEILKRKIK